MLAAVIATPWAVLSAAVCALPNPAIRAVLSAAIEDGPHSLRRPGRKPSPAGYMGLHDPQKQQNPTGGAGLSS